MTKDKVIHLKKKEEILFFKFICMLGFGSYFNHRYFQNEQFTTSNTYVAITGP